MVENKTARYGGGHGGDEAESVVGIKEYGAARYDVDTAKSVVESKMVGLVEMNTKQLNAALITVVMKLSQW